MFVTRIHLTIAALLGLMSAAPAAGQAGTRVTNTATLTWSNEGAPRSVQSNTVSLDLSRSKLPTALSLRLPPPDYVFTGGRCETTPTPLFTPAPIDEATFAATSLLKVTDTNQPLLIVLENEGGNRDPLVRETSWVQVESRSLRINLPLTETGPDSGIFAGGISPPGTNP